MSVNSLTTGLCLPPLDIAALLQGRMVVALSQTFRNPLQFALCPLSVSGASARQVAGHYRPSFLRSLTTVNSPTQADTMLIQAWAKLGNCRIYTHNDDLLPLSEQTVWSEEYLQRLLQEQHKLFVMSLQVYRFETPAEITVKALYSDRLGQYIKLPQPLSNRNAAPIISRETFLWREDQLVEQAVPQHPQLERFQAELVQVRENGLGAMSLDRDIRYFLGWSRPDETQLYDSDLVWIRQIQAAGQSGSQQLLPQLARQSLRKLGFRNHRQPDTRVATCYTDKTMHYCSWPYSFLACTHPQAINPIPPAVTTHIAQTQSHFPPEQVPISVLITACSLTASAAKAAIDHRLNIMRPETLQRLTELQAQHPGSIDLIKLKPCLESAPYGESADAKVNQFIDEILQQLELRAAIIRAVKNCLRSAHEESVDTNAIYFFYAASAPDLGLPKLTTDKVRDLLIEMASPLAGYLGRDESSDRFYFLRELHIEHGALAIETLQ